MHGHPLDLSGEWLAHAANPDLEKTFAEPTLSTAAWTRVRVPHHWRNEPEFAESDGPVLYRTSFTHEPTTGTRSFLQLDGICYFGDVWLDGEYLGATEGLFPHTFDVTDACQRGAEHILAIEVACPPQRDRGARRTITGPYWDSPLLDPECNPGGIWRAIRVADTGPVCIARARVVCTEASVERGRLACHLTLDAAEETATARLRMIVRGPGDVMLLETTSDVTLAAGVNELSPVLVVESPPRWWPRGRGPQSLCRVEIRVDVGGETSDTSAATTAFREVRRKGATFSVNGERMFLKGAHYGPARPLLGDADDALVRADVQRALDANLDLLRVTAHVAPDAFYEEADARGLLVWQDFPMHGGFARGVRKQATRQARAMVDALAHHPSIVVWCAHDAPLGDDTTARLVAGAVAPTWGKEVLDRAVTRAITRSDNTRPVVRHTGDGNDAHLWFGWRHGNLDDLAGAIRVVPRLGRFVAAFGAQSVPTTAEWLDPESWPDLDWEALAAHHGMERTAFERHVPPADAKSFDEWRDATQAYHAALLQLQIEDLRRCSGAPTGGFTLFTLADPSPAIGFGLLDHERVAKRAYTAVRDACRPALAMVDPRTGRVHAINDTTSTLDATEIVVTVDGRARRFTGTLDPGAVAFIGRVELRDAIDVEAVLNHPRTGHVVNRYPLFLLEAGRA